MYRWLISKIDTECAWGPSVQKSRKLSITLQQIGIFQTSHQSYWVRAPPKHKSVGESESSSWCVGVLMPMLPNTNGATRTVYFFPFQGCFLSWYWPLGRACSLLKSLLQFWLIWLSKFPCAEPTLCTIIVTHFSKGAGTQRCECQGHSQS